MARRIDPAALVVRVPGLYEHAIACQIDDARREVGRGARRRLTELESAYAAGESIIVAVSALTSTQLALILATWPTQDSDGRARDATSASLLCAYCSARPAGFMAVGSVHDVPHVWREVEGPSVVRSVNLEDATWQEVVGVVVGQDVLRRNRRRCIGAISDSERHAREYDAQRPHAVSP